MSTSPIISSPLPKLRSDLTLSWQGANGEQRCVVKDPVSGRFFQFRQVEGFILQRLDGTTDLDGLRAKVEQEFDANLSRATLEKFIEKLKTLGLLESEKTDSPASRSPRRKIQGSLFYLRLKAFDPDGFLGRLANGLGFVFTTKFFVLSAAFILIACGIAVTNWTQISHDFTRLWRLRGLALAYLTVLGVIGAHELAHGVACKRFGGSVHDLGVLLLYFQPTLYCNVSDAWLFPEKSKRLWVSFAGAYFELVLWAAATIVWRVTETSTTLNYLALVVMVTSGVKTLFNFNPLIRMDGYYLLSDYLGIPNLRQRAFSYLGDRIRVLRGASAPASVAVQSSVREKRIYLIYGLLAVVYTYWLLGWILLWAGRSLTGRFQAWGLVFFAGLVVAVFHRPLGQIVGRLKRMHLPTKKQAKWLAAAVVVLVVLFIGRMELKVSGEFKILPSHNADVRAEVEGLIETVSVKEGDTVHKGDPIAQLADRDYRSEWRKVNAEINEKEAKLKLLRAGSRAEEIEVARAALGRAQERVKYARQQFDILKGLFDQNLASRKEFTEVEEELAVRQKELLEAEGRLSVLLAGSRPEEIEATEAEIKRLQAQRAFLDDQLERVRVVSPIDGVITTPKLEEKTGQHVNKGDLIATVHELRTVRAEIAVSEKDISDVRLGQKVVVKARAFPQTSFAGTVTAIAPTVSKNDEKDAASPTVRTVTVTTRLDNPGFQLKPEMTGTAKIYCGKRRLLDLVTRRLARYLRVEFWSWW